LPRINTELHGKDRSKDTEGSRSSRSISHGRKTKNKQKNLPRNYTEKTRNQNAQAEERLDLRIREGDECAR
jgi:hypothetical protein